ncbi:MAG: hypothetical protein AAF717_00325 [Bacteroidota bacterium]
MKKLILPIVLLLLLTTCRTLKVEPSTTQTTTTVKDSISTRTEVQDSMLLVRKADTASISQLITSLNSTPITQKTGSATLSLRRIGNEIQAECECAELKEAVKLYKEIIEFYQNRETVIDTQTTVVQQKVPGYLKPFLWLGYLLSAGLLLFGGLKIYRVIKPI